MYAVTEKNLNDLAFYMDDEIRERIHNQIAPCSPAEFLAAYLQAAPEFVQVVNDFNLIEEPEEPRRYGKIADEIQEDAESEKAAVESRLYDRQDNIRRYALRSYSTAGKWQKYQAGEITEEAAAAAALARESKRIDKRTAEKLQKLDQIATAPECSRISIYLHFSRSGGVTAEGYTDAGEEATGHASGYGYDKASTAAAAVLNSFASVKKQLYDYKEKRLEEGATDTSETACTGRDNREIISYGAGYYAIPDFEGGVGMSSISHILQVLGYTCHYYNGGRESDIYIFERDFDDLPFHR